MKKKNKIACLVACALITIVGGAKTFSNVQQDSPCLILMEGVEALSTPGDNTSEKCYTINDEAFPVGDSIEHAYCVPNPAKEGNKHCLPQEDHKKGECQHKASTTHLNSYTYSKDGQTYSVQCCCM
jgi:hypothetical protein